jgi:hypothetical protein
VRPDLIVLADYFTYCAVMEWRYRLDPWFIEGYGVPVVPVDIWEWQNTDFTVDIAGDYVYRASDRFLSFPAHLRPVPLAHLDTSGPARPFRVWDREEPLPARSRDALRSSLGLGRHDRLVLLATAQWQVAGDADYSAAAAGVAAGVPRIVTHYLERLPGQTHFLLIGEVPPAWSGLPAGRVHAVPPCPPGQFGALLQAADAVLSLNVAATTVWRAVMSGVPAMVLGNGHWIRDAAGLEEAEAAAGGFTDGLRAAVTGCLPLHPFRMWPLGFHSFLAPLLTANPYTAAIAQAEVLDENAVVGGLTSLLFDPAARVGRLAAQHAYADAVRALPGTAEVFTGLAADLGARVG